MPTIEGFDCFPLDFDADGALTSRKALDALTASAAAPDVTDAIVIAHGFRNDANDATTLYTKFLKTLRKNLKRPEFSDLARRKFVVAMVYWPSKPHRENPDPEEKGARTLRDPTQEIAEARAQLRELKVGGTKTERAKIDRAITLLPRLNTSTRAQDQFVKLALSLVKRTDADQTEGLPQIRARSGSEILARLAPARASGSRGLGDVVSNVTGGVGRFLNLTLWYVMKDRSGTVGAKGVARAVRDLHKAAPDIRIHLVGHSLGGRLMAACVKALAASPAVRPDSLLLLEAAFSHYGFSPDNGRGQPGFFREVMTSQVVKGPFLSTFSAQDTVVGKAYSIMSRLAMDSTREVGDASDEFGGIGRNGPLKTAEVTTSRLAQAGTPYTYTLGVINNLDGSGGLIKDHGDVTSEAITYAFASAVART